MVTTLTDLRCFQHITDQLIANLNIVEALETDATFISLFDLSYIILLMAQGTHITFIDHIGATIETYFCVAAQFTFGDPAACHLAKLGRSKDLQHLRTANDLFLDLPVQAYR